MIEQVTFSELEAVLDVMPDDVTVLIVGTAGIGKSAFVNNWAQKQGKRYYEKNCAELLDIGDLEGRNSVVDGRTVLNPPPWFSATEPTILFLDEPNRAGSNAILRGIMGLVLNHSIAKLKLPPGSMVIAAANPDEGSAYDVVPFDLAQTNRFFVAEVKSDPEYWLNHVAIPNKYNAAVVKYIQKYKKMLNMMLDESAVNVAQSARYYRNVLATPRQWHSFARSLDRLEASLAPGEVPSKRLVEILGAGFVGPVVASSFATFYIERMSSSNIDVIKLLGVDECGLDEFNAIFDSFAEASVNDATKTCGVLTDIHEYLQSDGLGELDDADTCTNVATNYYKVMKLCSTELRKFVYTSHLMSMYKDRNSYIAKLIAAKHSIASLFSSAD